MKKALLVVDLQNDFLPGGALPVREGDQIIPLIDVLLTHSFDLVVASRDFHPKDHLSFASQHSKLPGDIIKLHGHDQILWPDHCVQGTAGADLAKNWDVDKIIYKGTNREYDSYSAFFDNERVQSTGLHDYLKTNGVTDLYIAGLATDYCVKFSALDALKLGYRVFIIQDACRGVNLKENDVQNALDEMEQAGAKLITSESC